MRVIAVANLKGGVGKTALALNFSSGLARHGLKQGWKVLLLDLCSQGDSTRAIAGTRECRKEESFALCLCPEDYLRETNLLPVPPITNLVRRARSPWSANLHYLPSNRELLVEARRRLESLPDRLNALARGVAPLTGYDFVVIDLGPAEDTMLAVTLMASDYVLIPVEMDQDAIDSAATLRSEIANLERGRSRPHILGVVANKVQFNHLGDQSAWKALETAFRQDLFPMIIPAAKDVRYSRIAYQDIYSYKPGSAAAMAFAQVTEEGLRRMRALERRAVAE